MNVVKKMIEKKRKKIISKGKYIRRGRLRERKTRHTVARRDK